MTVDRIKSLAAIGWCEIIETKAGFSGCPHVGRCHGCLDWCDQCGDVDQTCEGPVCFQHRCMRCNRMLTRPEREFLYHEGGLPGCCFDCEIREAVEYALRRDRNEVAAGLERDAAIAPFRSASR